MEANSGPLWDRLVRLLSVRHHMPLEAALIDGPALLKMDLCARLPAALLRAEAKRVRCARASDGSRPQARGQARPARSTVVVVADPWLRALLLWTEAVVQASGQVVKVGVLLIECWCFSTMAHDASMKWECCLLKRTPCLQGAELLHCVR